MFSASTQVLYVATSDVLSYMSAASKDINGIKIKRKRKKRQSAVVGVQVRVLPPCGMDVGEVSIEVSDITAWEYTEGEEEEKMKDLRRSLSSASET